MYQTHWDFYTEYSDELGVIENYNFPIGLVGPSFIVTVNNHFVCFSSLMTQTEFSRLCNPSPL
jgi:hypothetical protein